MWSKSGRTWARAAILFAAATASATASAQDGQALVVSYEVMEAPPPRPSTGGMVGVFIPGPDGSVTRLAQATLAERGDVKVQGSGTLQEWNGGTFEAHAQSRVSLTTGRGPLRASFTIDSPTAGVIPAKASGTIDLSALLTGVAPIAPVWGNWHTLGAASTRQSGSFTGVALVPVPCGETACYLEQSGGTFTFVPLQEHEFKDGVPLVKFVIHFTEVAGRR